MFTTDQVTEILATAEKIVEAAALIQRIQKAIDRAEAQDGYPENVIRRLYANRLDAELELNGLIAEAR